MTAPKTYDEQLAELFERIMAIEVAGGDASLLKEEMRRKLAQKPKEETRK